MRVAVLLRSATLLCTILLQLVTTVLGASLSYRFTARSFLPAGCFRSHAELNRIWNYTTVGKTGSNNVNYPNDFATNIQGYVGSSTGTTSISGVTGAQMCVIWNDIAAGKYNGHPDFEVSSSGIYAEGCSGTNDDFLTSIANGGTPCTQAQKLSKIVQNDLVTHEDGLPKPRYCTNNGVFPQDPRCGWRIPSSANGDKVVTTSGREWFDMWFRDNSVYNLRAGFSLRLSETSPGSGIFEYANTTFFPTSRLNGIRPCIATPGRTLDCSNGGKAFPLARKIDIQENENRQYSFTSEHHSFFELRGTETFTFEGDDDVWVFLNEKLAVDVGGLHPPAQSTIDLSRPAVRAALGMEIGGIYALDMYHAERRSSGSNFRIQTGLTGGCNILQSGKPAYVWSPANIQRDWKLIGGPGWGIVNSNQILLTSAAVQNSAGYAFLRQQVNVGTGFVINFSFTSSVRGEGFVLVLQRDDLVDMNGGSGGHLGFRNSLNSVGIVFDMCVDRDLGNLANPACNSREMRMHYLPNGGTNDATSRTRVLRAPLFLPVIPNDGAVHRVTVNYFARSPPWLEVLVDDDLLLQKRGIDLDQVIGGRNAFVGFTGSTGYTAATVRIFDVNINSVSIEDSLTQAVNVPQVVTSEPIVNGTADGRRPISFILQNFDACTQRIEFGGFAHRARGVLTLRERDNTTTATSRRELQSGNSTNATTAVVLVADIVDNDDGRYILEFKSTVAGVYDLQLWYGAGCFSNGNNTGAVLPNPPASTCFRLARNRSAVFSPVPPPILPPEDAPAQGLPQSALIGIGVAAGIVAAVGSVLLIIGVRFRNRWRRDKDFIEAGRQAVAERDVQYLGDADLDSLQQRLQATLHAIHAERAKKMQEGDKQTIIDELNRQRGEIQEQVRRLKIKLNGGDPNEPPPGFATRVRKSFAATRVSRGFSTRLSRGFSLMQGQPSIPEHATTSRRIDPYGGGEMSSGNPLFQRMSMSLGLRPNPPRAPPDV